MVTQDPGGFNPVGPSDHSCLGISHWLVGKELGKKLGGEDGEKSEWEAHCIATVLITDAQLPLT